MLTPSFEISAQPGSLRAVLRGFWDMRITEIYVAELLRAAKTVRSREPCWLIDCSDFPAQSGEVAERLTQGVEQAKQANPPEVAIVGNSALSARQARRAAGDAPQTRLFTLEAAEQWLQERQRSDPAGAGAGYSIAYPPEARL